MPDRFTHPFDLPVSPLMDGELEDIAVPAQPSHPCRGGGAVLQLDAVAQRSQGAF
jgi:hypothetical protein